MLTRRPGQRDVRHDRVLNRTVRYFAIGVLTGAGVLVATPAGAAGITITPSESLLYGLTQFTVSGYAAGVYPVYFNNVNVGQAGGDVDSGYFSVTLPVPAAPSPGVPHCGANTISVAGMTGTLTADCAAIQVTPTPVANSQLPTQFVVQPADFPAARTRQLTLDGVPQTPVSVNDGTGLGFTAAPGCGTHQVVLSVPYRGAVVSAQAPITVLCPTVSVNPSTIAQSAEPVQVSVVGGSFHPNQPVTVTVDGTTVGHGTTDGNGGITLPFPATGLGCATHQVTLTEQSEVPLSASTTLTVTCQSAAGTATLAINPIVLQPGMLTEATGSGFAPNQPVVLTWQAPDGTPLLGSTTVTASATGTIDTYCMVFDNDLLGDRQLVATQGTTTAQTPAVVDGGTMQPSTGDQLVFRR